MALVFFLPSAPLTPARAQHDPASLRVHELTGARCKARQVKSHAGKPDPARSLMPDFDSSRISPCPLRRLVMRRMSTEVSGRGASRSAPASLRDPIPTLNRRSFSSASWPDGTSVLVCCWSSRAAWTPPRSPRWGTTAPSRPNHRLHLSLPILGNDWLTWRI